MKKLILISFFIVVSCSENNKVESDQLNLKCSYVEISEELTEINFNLDNKNKGDKADLQFRGKSYTSVPVTWTPSYILIEFVHGDHTVTYKRTYTISRSNLNMEFSIITLKSIYGSAYNYPRSTIGGKCEVSEAESSKNVF